MGILVGYLAGILPKKIDTWRIRHRDYIINYETSIEQTVLAPKKRSLIKKGFLVIWLMLIALYIQSYYHMGSPLLPSAMVLKIFLRSLIILLTCYFVIGPLVTLMLNKYLQNKKVQEYVSIQKVLRLLPGTKQLVKKAWQLTALETGKNRLFLCSKIILINLFVIHHE